MVTQISPMNHQQLLVDNRMVLTGNFTTWNGTPCGYIVRLNTDRPVDPTFTPGSGADNQIMQLELEL